MGGEHSNSRAITATDVEGIFRLSGSAKRIKDLQEIFDSPERYGKGLDWTGYTVHDAANVLRRYLNNLPEPIVPLEFYERFREPLRNYLKQVDQSGANSETLTVDHKKAVAAYQQLIRDLPPLNRQLLLYILDLLAVFASKSDQNRMTSANLSAIFQPGLLSHPQHHMSPDDYRLSQDVLIFLIENQDHFLFGMNGTAADEQTMKEVEGGLAPTLPSHSTTVRRSVSSASNGKDSLRKYENLRRNVSVSSKTSHHSRQSGNVPTPSTPTSVNGSGVHRSNTLPLKRSPVVGSSRYGRAPEQAPANNPTGLRIPAEVVGSSRYGRTPEQGTASNQSSFRTPTELVGSGRYGRIPERVTTNNPVAPRLPPQVRRRSPNNPSRRYYDVEPANAPPPAAPQGRPQDSSRMPSGTYVHTSSHGPIAPQEAFRMQLAERPRLGGDLPPNALQHPPVPAPVTTPPAQKERKISNLFAKSPSPNRESSKEPPRQPNKLRKKKIFGSTSESAQSSSQSLGGMVGAPPSASYTSPKGSRDSLIM